MNILSKIKVKGWAWFYFRLKQEFRNPKSLPLRQALDACLRLQNMLVNAAAPWKDNSLLYTIYDLDINPVTFNFAEFLIDAELESQRRGKTGFVVVIVPLSENPNPHLSWQEYDSVVDISNKKWRLQNIVVPLAPLSAKCRGLYLLPNRNEAGEFVKGREIYPEFYDGVNLRAVDLVKLMHKLNFPGQFEGLCAPRQGLLSVENWRRANAVTAPLITITLRNFAFDSARNSNMAAWAQFAKYLVSMGFHPVIVPDTETAFETPQDFEGISIFRECSWNVGLRISLYESAYLNFFVPNGCAMLAVFNPKCSYIMMNCLPEGSSITTAESYKKIGYSIGESYRFATKSQTLCYEPDSFENILAEFNRFLANQKNA